MVEYKFLRYLYPMYLSLHFKYPFPRIFQWVLAVIVFIQYTFLVIYIGPPSEFFDDTSRVSKSFPFFHYILSMIYILPWIFGIDSMIYDSIFWLIINLVFIGLIAMTAFRSYNRKKQIPFWFLVWGRLVPQFLIPIFSVPLFFRISYVIEKLIISPSAVVVISLALYIINLFIFFCHQYLASVFLIPICFLRRARLDVFDGKTHLFLTTIQFIFATCFQLMPIWKNYKLAGVAFLIYFILLCFLLYFRLLTTVHVSLTAQYIELAPLFVMPFMTLFHMYASMQWFYFLIILFALHIIFLILINLTRNLMKQISFQIFSNFLYNDSAAAVLPKFVPGNICSIIRIVAHYNSDPAVLSRFLENQRQTQLRTSVFLEISRFLVIFPEYRKNILAELTLFSSNSTYNRYSLYLFRKSLKSMSTKNVNKYLYHLDQIYGSYIVHFFLYWNSRKNRQYFRAFIEAYTSASFFMEGRNELRGLLNRFPCCPNLIKIYAELLLNLDGDFEGYKKQLAIAKSLEKNANDGNSTIFDPLLHPMAMINPKILQYCYKDIRASSSSSSTVFSGEPVNSFFSRKPHKKDNFRKNKKKKSVASKIMKSHRKVPYFNIWNSLLPAIIIVAFAFHALFVERDTINKERQLNVKINDLSKSLYAVFAAMFVPYALATAYDSNMTDSTACSKTFLQIPSIVSGYFSDSPLISYLNGIMMVLTFREINPILHTAGNLCDIVNQLPTRMESLATSSLIDIISRKFNFSASLYIIHNQINQIYDYGNFLKYSSIIMAIFIFIYFLVNFIFLNVVMNGNQKAIDFLSSEERLATVIQELEVRETVWEQLNDFASSSINISDSSIAQFQMESESETETTWKSQSYTGTNGTTTTSSSATTNNAAATNTTTTTASSTTAANNYGFAAMNMNPTNDSDFSESDERSSQRSKISITPTSFTGSALNLTKQPKAFVVPTTSDNSRLVGDLSDNAEMMIDNNNNPSKLSPRAMAGNIHSPIDISMLQSIVSKKSKNDRFFVAYSFLKVFLPWILLYIFCLLAYCPLVIQRNNETKTVEGVNLIDSHMTAAISLLNLSYFQFYRGITNTTAYEEIEKVFVNYKSDISILYFNETCFRMGDLICISVSSIVHQLIYNQISEYFLVKLALPAIVAFTEKAMTMVFIVKIQELKIVQSSSSICFCINTMIVVLAILVARLVHNFLLQRGFNSLFHFPDIFAKKKLGNDEKEKVKKIKRFPTNILLVTSVSESDEIYSISDNSLSIIGKSSSEMICRKLQKTFPVVDEKAGFQIRENNGKTFISRSQIVGRLTKTILIETTKIEMKSKGFNVLQKLSNFMPLYFAKSFSEDLQKFYHFEKSALIFIRIDSKAGQLEKFFTCIDMQIQMFFNIEFIRSNGSILTCICRDPNHLEIFLFIRDIIKESENSCRGQKANFALKSIYVDYIEELNFEISEGSEPTAKIEEMGFLQKETYSLEVDNHCICGSNQTAMGLSIIKSYTNTKKMSNGCNMNMISFDKFTNDFCVKL